MMKQKATEVTDEILRDDCDLSKTASLIYEEKLLMSDDDLEKTVHALSLMYHSFLQTTIHLTFSIIHRLTLIVTLSVLMNI